jgi:hypothetical protein
VILGVRRDASRTNLLVIGQFPGPSPPTAVFVNASSINTTNAPSSVCFPGTSNTISAWLDADGGAIHFVSGRLIQRPKLASFDIDASSRYYIIGESKTKTLLGRLPTTIPPYEIVGQLLGTTLFTAGKRICVCGVADTRDGSLHATEPFLRCLVFEDEGNGFTLLSRHDLPWAAGACDLDSSGGHLLLQGTADLGPGLYLYDLTTRTRRKLGNAKEFNFFLNNDPLRKSN